MHTKIKKARENLIKSAEELDSISKCYHAREKKAISTIVKVVLKEYYKY